MQKGHPHHESYAKNQSETQPARNEVPVEAREAEAGTAEADWATLDPEAEEWGGTVLLGGGKPISAEPPVSPLTMCSALQPVSCAESL